MAEWMAYYSLEPFGEDRDDLRMAINASSIVNTILSMLGKKGKTKFLKLKDFIPEFGNKEKKSPDYMLEKMKELSKIYGGELIIGDEDGDDPINPSN